MPEPILTEYANGNKAWCLNGKFHREDGPAIEYANYKHWYFNGQLHREDGPAIEYPNGHKEWWLNDKRHRVDGPAIEFANGSKAWFLNGNRYIEEEYVMIQFMNGKNIYDMCKI